MVASKRSMLIEAASMGLQAQRPLVSPVEIGTRASEKLDLFF